VSRILIAEDEARIASFVEKGLRAAGFAVTVTADGREALAQAQPGQFDLGAALLEGPQAALGMAPSR
jgi:DNA-binding response OmpR family regulator